MSELTHPKEALFVGEKTFPIIPSCEHFAGSEKLILKALEMQDKLGPIFDITCDCEDGAATGQEQEHAQMVVDVLSSQHNKHNMAGVRIHDYSHNHWQKDIDIIIPAIGDRVAYITMPKATAAIQLQEMICYLQASCKEHNINREIPVHALIETHGALHEIWKIAALDWVQVLDFGMMDFVSGHNGAIPASAMRSPGQFDHELLRRAKAEVCAAALCHGVVPSHNVTLDLKSPYQTFDDASRARNDFGFLRMWSIYPTQISAIVDAMKPDYSEVIDGANILIAAQDNNWGPIQYEGELHDRATYRYFWELLQKAKIMNMPLPEAAEKRFF
jgi:citrate lyase subunit beta/citryl-CoA lyase